MSGDEEAEEAAAEPVEIAESKVAEEPEEVVVTGGKPEGSESVESVVTDGRPGGPLGVKWQVWVPVVLGLVSALLSKLSFPSYFAPTFGLTSGWWDSYGTLLFSGDIYTLSLFIISFKLYSNWESRAKFLLGGGLSVSLCLLGVVYLSVICWGFMIIGWILLTIVWGQYRLSPPRTGIWLGFGGAVAIVLGNLLIFFLL